MSELLENYKRTKNTLSLNSWNDGYVNNLMDTLRDYKKEIIKLQATLTKISLKVPVFFNITQYKNMGLVKEHGKTLDLKTNWILTAKAKQYLNIQL